MWATAWHALWVWLSHRVQLFNSRALATHLPLPVAPASSHMDKSWDSCRHTSRFQPRVTTATVLYLCHLAVLNKLSECLPFCVNSPIPLAAGLRRKHMWYFLCSTGQIPYGKLALSSVKSLVMYPSPSWTAWHSGCCSAAPQVSLWKRGRGENQLSPQCLPATIPAVKRDDPILIW